jgi:tetratricopeptide (TPR) repeat protein
MTRSLVSIIAGVLLTLASHAAPAPPAFEGILIQKDGSSRRVFVVTATKASIRYREDKDAAEIKDLRISDLKSIFLTPPPALAAALDLFQGRRYQEAKIAFSEIRTLFQPVVTVRDNPATLAAFYELECFRKLGDLDGLSEALKKFDKDPLVRENHLRQIEMYVFWDAVRTKNWNRLVALAKDREKQHLPDYQRAQVAYCQAIALEALGRRHEALEAHNIAMTADSGASEEIARKSALAILRILSADPAVQESLKIPAANHPKLVEARAVARLYELSLGSGEALPDEYQVFLKD